MEWSGPIRPFNIELPEDLHRRVKAEAPLRRKTLKQAYVEGMEKWLDGPEVQVNTRKDGPGNPANDSGTNGNIGTNTSVKCDNIHNTDEETGSPDLRLDWYMRKIAEIMSVISVDEELALRFLIESVDVRVKLHGGSVSISGNPDKEATPSKRRMSDSAIQEGLDRAQAIADEHLSDPPTITGARKRGQRKAR